MPHTVTLQEPSFMCKSIEFLLISSLPYNPIPLPGSMEIDLFSSQSDTQTMYVVVINRIYT